MYEEKEIKYKKRKKEKNKNPKSKKSTTPEFIKKINWQQLIIKLLILLMVMILIIFTISRISKNNKEKNTTINKNLNEIIEGTLKLYNNQNLPHNIGDSTSLLLDEMLQKEIISPIKDSQKKACDFTNSYIIITKIAKEEYRLKIYLTCPSESKAIERAINCTTECQIENS